MLLSVNIDEQKCREKVQINKMRSACNPRAKGSNVLANQKAGVLLAYFWCTSGVVKSIVTTSKE